MPRTPHNTADGTINWMKRGHTRAVPEQNSRKVCGNNQETPQNPSESDSHKFEHLLVIVGSSEDDCVRVESTLDLR